MVNDSSIIMGIFIFFIGLGTLLPFITADFGGSSTQNNMPLLDIHNNNSDSTETECRYVYTGVGGILGSRTLVCGLPKENTISAWDITKSIAKMFTWSFGTIPLFLDLLIFLPMRILLMFLVYRSIRSGGG